MLEARARCLGVNPSDDALSAGDARRGRSADPAQMGPSARIVGGNPVAADLNADRAEVDLREAGKAQLARGAVHCALFRFTPRTVRKAPDGKTSEARTPLGKRAAAQSRKCEPIRSDLPQLES
jgi:hypothetical protein